MKETHFYKTTNIGGEMCTRNSAIACQVMKKRDARFEVSAGPITEVGFWVVALSSGCQHAVFMAAHRDPFCSSCHDLEDYSLSLN